MAIALKPKDQQQYDRLVGMTQPSATPSKRIGTEAPTGSVAAGPAAGKSAAEFTQTTKSSPGSVFARQMENANIEGITSLAEKPLIREAGAEGARVIGEGVEFETGEKNKLKNEPQMTDFSAGVTKIGEGDEGTTATGQAILNRSSIPTGIANFGDIKEFTPLQALRGGSVEGLLRKEAKGPYTTGMAGLDALLFQKKGGAAALGTKGIALQTAEQATADALEKKLTDDAKKNAETFVANQKAGLTGALTGALDPMLAKFQEGLGGLAAGRQATISQAGSAIEQDFALKQQQARTQILNELKASGKQLTPEEETFILNTLMRSPTNQKLSNAYTLPEYVAPTLADVATDPETKTYTNLLQMLGLGGGDTGKYNLGNRTNLGKASGPVNFDEYAGAQILGDYRNEAVNALNQYRSDASLAEELAAKIAEEQKRPPTNVLPQIPWWQQPGATPFK
jgi:hypothetical protein